jgi:hypothetical protein
VRDAVLATLENLKSCADPSEFQFVEHLGDQSREMGPAELLLAVKAAHERAGHGEVLKYSIKRSAVVGSPTSKSQDATNTPHLVIPPDAICADCDDDRTQQNSCHIFYWRQIAAVYFEILIASPRSSNLQYIFQFVLLSPQF